MAPRYSTRVFAADVDGDGDTDVLAASKETHPAGIETTADLQQAVIDSARSGRMGQHREL